MKITKLLPVLLFLTLISCSNDPRTKLAQTGLFGENFEVMKPVAEANSINFEDSSIMAITQITGTVEKYCKGEGCWLTLKRDKGYILVNAKDKKFILPHQLSGKLAIANGRFIREVEKDHQINYSFEASGILIQNP